MGKSCTILRPLNCDSSRKRVHKKYMNKDKTIQCKLVVYASCKIMSFICIIITKKKTGLNAKQ